VALKQLRPHANRYKKSGKGGFVLAVFIVCCCLLLVAGYLLHRYQQQRPVVRQEAAVQKKTVVQQPAPQKIHSSIKTVPAVVDVIPPIKQDYYTGELKPEKQAPQQKGSVAKAELAIVVDDMGSSLQEAQALAAIGLPINFAIIPGLRHYREVADYAAGQGIEILIHIPMQSKEYPRRRLETNGLLLEYSDEELRSRVLGYLEILPKAVGANNHMGSGFTEHADKMRVVLQVLKENKLFFLDSITTPLTVGPKVAAELRMHHTRRDVFLDNEQNESYIRGQLAQAIERARKNGHAIAICHPHPMTIATLIKALPELKTKGVKLVAVTKLVH
jgi:uncharacterized protein